MINTIEPTEFLNMLSQELRTELEAEYGIGDGIIMEVCQFLNDIRSGVKRSLRITPVELNTIKVTGNRIYTKGSSYLLKHHHKLKNVDGDWVMNISTMGSNNIEMRDGNIVWTLLRDEGKRYPKAYKLFMKFLFSNFNNTAINNLDIFYESYIRNYNEIYASHYGEEV